MAATTRQAGLYARISQDRDGEGQGVERQLEDGTALAFEKGWAIADQYVDNDRSAWTGKPRPEYERLLADLRSGRIDAVIAWAPDRLYRQMREVVGFIDVVTEVDAEVATVRGGPMELDSALGRMLAQILGSVAQGEADLKSERQRRKAEQLAKQGRSGGGGRSFGYTASGKIIEEEAVHIREAVKRVLAGEGLRGICRDWDKRGIPTPRTAKVWSPQALKVILTSARIAGWREYKGELVAVAVWPPIIDLDTLKRVRTILRDPRRRTNERATKHLLAGFLRCGNCESILSGRPKFNTGSHEYRCRTDLGGCGNLSVVGEPVEEAVREMLVLVIDGPEFGVQVAAARTPATDTEAELQERIAREQSKIHQALEDLDEERLNRSEVHFLVDRARSRQEQAQASLDALQRTTDLRSVESLSGALGDTWESLSFDRRRAIVGAVIDHVRVKPAVRGRNKFDVNRLDPVWRV